MPTLAVAEAGTPPHLPLKRSGVTLARLESGIAARTDARLESGGGKAGADQLYWAAAAAAHELHGKQGGKVDLRRCGKFTLAEDLSDISDMTRIDLSSIYSLEGEPLEKFPGVFFCVPVRFF